jgi:CDP-diglyceride synthetase
LDAFPFAEGETAPGGDSSQVCLVDARIAREFPALLHRDADALYVLANSVAVSPEPLGIEEKVALFEMGLETGAGAGIILGIGAAVAAPLGDLCQSLLKRDLGVKDMGTLLPGHGGMLDRIDGMLFVVPALYWLTVSLG